MTGHVTKPGVDWAAIRNEYESGLFSARQLARRHLISHTAINKRIKGEGWVVSEAPKVSIPAILETGLSLSHPPAESDAKREEIVGRMADGAPPTMAAALANVTMETFTRWLEEPGFALACKRAQWSWAQKHVRNIDKASDRGDWRAADTALSKHPISKEIYGAAKDTGGPKVEIVFQGMPAPKAVTVNESGTRAVIEHE